MAIRVYATAVLLSAVTSAAVSLAVVLWFVPRQAPADAAPQATAPEAIGVPTRTVPRSETEAGRKDDLLHSEQVCHGFLTSLRSFDEGTVRAFCTPEYAKQIKHPFSAPDTSWVIETKALAAGGREASFRGAILTPGTRSRFVLVAVREPAGDQGRWLVGAFTVGDPEK